MKSVIIFAAGAVVAILASLAAVSLLDQAVSYPTMIAILAVVLLAALTRELVVFRDPLTPAGVVAITGLLLFVLRPLTIMWNRVTSPGAIADSRDFTPTLILAGSAALVECLIFFCAFFLVYYFITVNRERNALADFGMPRRRRSVDSNALQAVVIIASAVAVGALGYLVLSSGGPGAYFAGLANRSDFLSGKSFLVLGYVPVQIALVANVVHRRQAGLPVWHNWVNLVGLISLAICGVAAGGRGPLVVGVVLPLVLLKQIGPKPFKLRTIATLGLALVIIAISYSIVVRNANFDQGRSLNQLASDPVGVLLDQVTSGAETRPFDSLIRLNEVVAQDPDFEFQRGATYAAVPAWFVPRAVWANKPSGGGNTWFTSTYVPRFYGTTKVETSLSAVGEAYGNFGHGGVAVAGALMALLASTLTRSRLRERGVLGLTISVSLTPILFSLIRGDAYQGGSLTIATVLLATVMYLVVSRPYTPERAPLAPGKKPPALIRA
ncbi:oligosaccharide repeat unit polymerase [Subtercola sp. Z020]|uniref:O-antigen polymerase n=1 Tax=Subtercola sp. Z020 TaxID=2080582 RepID=UPI000CE90B8F|nr:O-antigen polymerase [Subtercola sp. Z020]PPF81331.1 oligosaccharide repeat unit polymerase [Subtercola sp. Z020]